MNELVTYIKEIKTFFQNRGNITAHCFTTRLTHILGKGVIETFLIVTNEIVQALNLGLTELEATCLA